MSSNKKVLNNREAMEALLAGARLTSLHWSEEDYIYLNEEGDIVDEHGMGQNLYRGEDYLIYKPPKKRRKVVRTMYQAVVKHRDGAIILEQELYDSKSILGKTIDECKYINLISVIEHQIEIDAEDEEA